MSSREVVASVLDRVEAVNPSVNAVVDVMADEALASAALADDAVARGEVLGPLHGVPITIKVNVDVADRPTTGRIIALADHVADKDAPLVRNLRRAGAVIVGRTNTPCFSIRWFTDNDLHGRTSNPWDPAVTPGGSSGGAAAALATGMGSIAHGNDYGGSIRHPAWACGVVGLRPTVGRVPSYNASAMAERCDRQPADVGAGSAGAHGARCSCGVRGDDRRRPSGSDVEPGSAGVASTRRPVRVAVFREPQTGSVHPSVLAAIDQAAAWLADAGCVIEEASPPRSDEAAELWTSLVFNDFRRGGQPAIEELGDRAVKRALELYMEAADELDRNGYLDALARRLSIAREWSVFLDRYDVVLTANCWERHFPIDDDQRSVERMREILHAQSPLLSTAMLGLPGLPGLAVPVGVDDGLPTGVQLVANRYREDLLLAAGDMIEERSGYDVLDQLPA